MIQWKQPNTSAIVCSTSELKVGRSRDNVSMSVSVGVSVSLSPRWKTGVFARPLLFFFFPFSVHYDRVTRGLRADRKERASHAGFICRSRHVLFIASAAEAARPCTRGAELEGLTPQLPAP